MPDTDAAPARPIVMVMIKVFKDKMEFVCPLCNASMEVKRDTIAKHIAQHGDAGTVFPRVAYKF